jgi:hypothetical protein
MLSARHRVHDVVVELQLSCLVLLLATRRTSLLPVCCQCLGKVQVWAMLMYFDDVLGRLADYVEKSPLLSTNTFILISGAWIAKHCCHNDGIESLHHALLIAA